MKNYRLEAKITVRGSIFITEYDPAGNPEVRIVWPGRDAFPQAPTPYIFPVRNGEDGVLIPKNWIVV